MGYDFTLVQAEFTATELVVAPTSATAKARHPMVATLTVARSHFGEWAARLNREGFTVEGAHNLLLAQQKA
jgi:hypothetical protein